MPSGAIMDDRMADELQAVIAELGGEKVLGRALRTDNDLRSAIREGFPQKVVGSVMNSAGLTLKELSATLDLSPRSLQRRRHQGRLAPLRVRPPVSPGAHCCAREAVHRR